MKKTRYFKTMNKRNITTVVIAATTLLAGLVVGWMIFGGSQPSGDEIKTFSDNEEVTTVETIWTCSMHPQVRQSEPGKCPICGMDLIPLVQEQGEETDPDAIRMSPVALKLADVQSMVVGTVAPVKHVRLTGKVQSDERLVYSQSSHLPGRVEELTVNFTGQFVLPGQALAYIYSPELVTAQEELLEAHKIKDSQPGLILAAREKLKNWKLTESQIDNIINSGNVSDRFPIHADVSGWVTAISVSRGDYVKKGQELYTITDLRRVWVLFDVYESDIQWIRKGDNVIFRVGSLPGEKFNGIISYVDPFINPVTRIVRARVVMDNSKMLLKPEMFVSGTVEAELVNQNAVIAVPKTAVMWTGKRSVVYVKIVTDASVSFLMRVVELGPDLGDSYIIESNLMEGEEIAVNGTFSIDAAAQLAGKPSMMNPEGGMTAAGHNHGETSGTPEKNMTEAGIVNDMAMVDIPSKFKTELTVVYKAYLKMKNAFVASDAEQVSREAAKVVLALKEPDMTLLKGEAHEIWMEHIKALNKFLSAIAESKDIELQRKEFAQFNLLFYKTVKFFGLNGEETYYQFCPMAEDNRGAYWLSESEEIRNPYFGDAMLTCGETKEIIR